MLNIWITSDTHFWHANIIKYCERPYKDAQEMNEKMILAWNTVVKQNDTVYHLGDFSLAARPVETILPRLLGKKHLIMGNHDFPHPAHPKGRKPELAVKWLQQYLDWGFETVKLEDQLDVPGVANFQLHHMPYKDAYTEDSRQFKQSLLDLGRPLLHGHVHTTWNTRRTSKGTLMINVGVDSPGMSWQAEYRPAHLDEIKAVYLNA